jgi:hypothetical protein
LHFYIFLGVSLIKGEVLFLPSFMLDESTCQQVGETLKYLAS